MDEQQRGEPNPASSSPATTTPAATASLPTAIDRKGGAVGGGLLAGLGLSIAVVLVMHVIQVATNSYYLNLDPYVILVLLVVGPLFGFGIGLAIAALIPPDAPDSRVPSTGTGNPA